MLIYILSKILPLIFQPVGLTLILIFLFLKSKKRWIIYLALATLWSFSTHFIAYFLINIVENPWHQKSVDSISTANAIVVLSGGLQPFGNKLIKHEWQDPDRFFFGIDLLKANKAPYIVFTGGIRPLQKKSNPESIQYIEKAMSFGINENQILTTGFAKNTRDEAFRVKELFLGKFQKEKNRIILVTSAFHMKRAKKIFERQSFEVIPFPVDFKNFEYQDKSFIGFLFRFSPNVTNLSKSSLAIREIMGRIIYRSF